NWSKENKEHKECESGTSKERKRKFETEEENNQTWRVGSYRQEKKISKRAEFTDQRNRKQYSKKSIRVNSSQLQNTKEDTRAHNSSTLKINRICKSKDKDKEIIVKSSKKVFSKENWSIEKDFIYKKNGSSLVDQIKAG
ncbi:45591_t:CDS:2, partial [Gigaspora margarita]